MTNALKIEFSIYSHSCSSFRAVRGILKIRYILLGGAIGGGMTVNKKYEEWRDGLPDLKWLDEVLPDTEQFRAFNKNLSTTLASFKNSVQLGKDNPFQLLQYN